MNYFVNAGSVESRITSERPHPSHVLENLPYRPYQEAVVLPPVKQNRRAQAVHELVGYGKISQRRIDFENDSKLVPIDSKLIPSEKLMRRKPTWQQLSRKHHRKYMRHKTIRKTPPTRSNRTDWSGYAKIDVPSFGYFVPFPSPKKE